MAFGELIEHTVAAKSKKITEHGNISELVQAQIEFQGSREGTARWDFWLKRRDEIRGLLSKAERQELAFLAACLTILAS